ncbi:hypothetical protein [Streptomyces sp. NRRL F-2747]|uniref:hypothetical protein n=1 Tax=Streptomyces sp. NRRL F-2747 TaxID=1463843 RepID=UPI00131C5DFD|nr:hypothetical protein [Streptomyces sp. NRRL F-2747]
MRNRTAFIATTVILTMMGSVPAASSATTAHTAVGAKLNLALPAAALVGPKLTVRRNGDSWTLTVEWGISYTATNLAYQTTYKTWANIIERDDGADDHLAAGFTRAASVKPRAQGHNGITQTFTFNSAALNTEIGDEEIYASVYLLNTKTGLSFASDTPAVELSP